uniref:Uncharacterized protein n=1 Tax=Leersia perrieri TaxID=77586 RepID=A0A0D9X678_9ORYZ
MPSAGTGAAPSSDSDLISSLGICSVLRHSNVSWVDFVSSVSKCSKICHTRIADVIISVLSLLIISAF